MNHPRIAFGASPQGGTASGPAEPGPRRPLGGTGDDHARRSERSGHLHLVGHRSLKRWAFAAQFTALAAAPSPPLRPRASSRAAAPAPLLRAGAASPAA